MLRNTETSLQRSIRDVGRFERKRLQSWLAALNRGGSPSFDFEKVCAPIELFQSFDAAQTSLIRREAQTKRPPEGGL
jgi:hypothetical protein